MIFISGQEVEGKLCLNEWSNIIDIMQFFINWFCSKSFRAFFVFWWKVGGVPENFWFATISNKNLQSVVQTRGKFSTKRKHPWISEVCGAPAVWTHHLENTQLVQWMQLCKHLPTPPTPPTPRALRERERRPDWTPGFVPTVVGKCPVNPVGLTCRVSCCHPFTQSP